MSEEILRGAFKGKDLINVDVEGDAEAKKLKFDAVNSDEAKGPELAAVGEGEA